MSEHESDEEKHVTAAAATEPEEDFIEQKARPSRDESEVQVKPPAQAGEGI